MMQLRKYRNQKGFTLVEIAIVLVIVGLVLFGVLKGTEMVKSGKVKKTIKQYEQLQSSIYAYADKKGGAFPAQGSSDSANTAVLAELNTAGFTNAATMTNGFGETIYAQYIAASKKIEIKSNMPCDGAESAAGLLVSALGATSVAPSDGNCDVTLTIVK